MIAMPSMERVPAADGFELAATLYRSEAADTVVLINSATAVPRRLYGPFAAYLQELGWSAVTYDYRGIGDSRPPSLRGFDARMRDWALLDMTAMIDWIRASLEPRRLFVVGHSFGGQALGMIENAGSVDAMVGVAAQSGYWGLQGGREPARARLFVTLLIPVLSRLLGYFPWGWFGPGEHLPKYVALEWARWCRDPDYLLGDASLPLARYRDWEGRVLAYSIDDDDWGTAQSVDAMMRAYGNVTRRHICPADYGLEQLGHVGFFRDGSQPIWRETAEWLDST